MLKRSAPTPPSPRPARAVIAAKRSNLIARKGLSWIPWQTILSRIARGHGFIDPGDVLKRLRAFAKPSEVGEPVELLRAGVVFHARGLVNTRAIQFNLDWVWPFWVEQQFNPESDSFIPRAFSFSHINLTHRNWTAAGLPDVPHYPIVDPRGLVTPLFDGWSLDFWIVGEGEPLLPSRCAGAAQSLELGDNLVVRTLVNDGARALESRVRMEADGDEIFCMVSVQPCGGANDRLVIAARPYNPEGVSFIDSIALSASRQEWTINGSDMVRCNRAPERTVMSRYSSGDVLAAIARGEERDRIECSIGMATAALVFPGNARVELRVPIPEATEPRGANGRARASWRSELEQCAVLRVPDERWQRLYDTAVRTLILHTPAEVFPGPFTYRRFWYRDAALILNALVTIGASERTRRALELFPRGQLRDGYFRSQEGEWDSNGQVLWILERYLALSGEPMPAAWAEVVERGARWITTKRMGAGSAHPGLLPAGFSAEHLGPNDYYYWDDFWGVAGLRAAARMRRDKDPAAATEFTREADDFIRTIEQSIARALPRTGGAIPAAPERRMDAGAIGSLVADFPLQLLPARDERTMASLEWLLAKSFVRGGFFQDMIHSGINAYLTLHVAQVLLRAGDRRAHDLIEATAALASPTGQWPEAIHPRTLGGCMGDGQHVWAAAEWILMLRNLFVREEGESLVIGSGVREEWIRRGESFGIERTLTPFGKVSVRFTPRDADALDLNIQGEWRDGAPRLDLAVPRYRVDSVSSPGAFTLRRG